MSATDDPDVLAISRISAVPTVLRVITQLTGLRLALIARVTQDSWKACAVLDLMNFGIAPGDMLDVATTLCAEVRKSKKPIVLENIHEDPVYRHHPSPRLYKVGSYVAVPIFLRNGEYFGNVCAVDSRPMPLKHSETLAMMELYAELVGLQLEAEERHHSTRTALLDATQTAELREQFIAVLGHDIRTPLAAIHASATTLAKRGSLGSSERQIAERIRASAERIERLVADVLDFARGRLGGGISLVKTEVSDLEPAFAQIVEEARATHSNRVVDFHCAHIPRFACDRDRLTQVLSNLLINALDHSPASAPVEVEVGYDDGLFLRVTNGGEPIPEWVRERLFHPFARGGERAARGGLGLGLYIVAEIVRAHGGTVQVTSSQAEGTSFVRALPRPE